MALLVRAGLLPAGRLAMTLGRVRVAEYLGRVSGLALAASGSLVLCGGAIVCAAPALAALLAVVVSHSSAGYPLRKR